MYSTYYKRYVTVLLLVVYIFNQTDRAIFGFLMEPIKHDLGLSDSELGFLAGPALAVLYALLGIPVARLADKYNRVNIISVAVALWSTVVMASASVATFWQFTLARVGVGIGEAGFSAVAQSLLSDYHSAKDRTRALSTFMLAIPLGGVVSSLTAGWVNEAYGWRAAFIAAGLPGILLAVLMKYTVKEPVRGATSASAQPTSPHRLRDVLAMIWRRRTLRHLAFAATLLNTVCAAIVTWTPAFFMRNHAMSSGELGIWLATIIGGGGSAGVWLGGYLTTRYGANDDRIKLRLIAAVTAVAPAVVVMALWVPAKYAALLLFIPAKALLFLFYGPTFALVQGLSAVSVRATVAAVFILLQVLCGGVFGVQLLGIASDVITSVTGDSALALRVSMTLICALAIWAAAHFWLAGLWIRHDGVDSQWDTHTAKSTA